MTLPPSRLLDFTEVPVIDIASLVAGRGEAAAIDAIRRACTDIGFMYVTNHGVERALLDRAVAAAKAFFSLPLDEKMSVTIEDSPQFRGFMPVKYKGEGNDGKNIQEGFVMMREAAPGTTPMAGANRWPARLPGLQAALTPYFAAVEALARKMIPGFALALGVEPARFAKLFADPMLMIKLNHYPAQEPPESDEEIGVRGHSDRGGFTILWQDDVGGLEIRNKSGEWVVVPPLDGTYVINLGDMMQAWSNGRFSSTEHRVINRYGVDRYSIPMFVNPGYDAVIEPLVDGAAPGFEPYPAGPALQATYRRIWPQRKIAA